jgi:subtilisin-like proprotein convertase family protein
VTAGGSTTFTVSNTASGGFASAITLSATPAISGVSYAFSPNPMAAGGSSTLTCTTTAAAAPGTYTLTILGTGGSLSRTTTVQLTVSAPSSGNAVKTFSAAPNLAVPDNNTTGVTSTLNFAQTGTVSALKVRVNVTHPYKGDLEVALIGPDNTTVLLHNRTGTSTDNVITVFPDLTAPAQSLGAFTGKSINGAWRLRVRDLAATDVGTFVNWTLCLEAQ